MTKQIQAPVLSHIDVTDTKHVQQVIEQDRRFQANMRKYKQWLSEYNRRYHSNHKKQNSNEK